MRDTRRGGCHGGSVFRVLGFRELETLIKTALVVLLFVTLIVSLVASLKKLSNLATLINWGLAPLENQYDLGRALIE